MYEGPDRPLFDTRTITPPHYHRGPTPLSLRPMVFVTLYTTGAVLAGIVVTDAGDVYVSAPELNQIGRLAPGGEFQIVAGNGSRGYRDGPADLAMFNYPTGLADDPGSGRIFIAVQLNHCVRVYDPTTATVSTLVRGLSYPYAVQYGAGSRQLFVQHDPLISSAIRRLDPSGAVTVVVANYTVSEWPVVPIGEGSRMALAGANGDVLFVVRGNSVDRVDVPSGRITDLRTLLNPASIDKIMIAPIGVVAAPGQQKSLIVLESYYAYRLDLGSGSLSLLSGYQERVQFGAESGSTLLMQAASLRRGELHFIDVHYPQQEGWVPHGNSVAVAPTFRIRKVAL